MAEPITYDPDDDTFTMTSKYFGEMMAKLVAGLKTMPAENDETVAAMDAAFRERFPNGNRLVASSGAPLQPRRTKTAPRTASEQAEYAARFPNADRLSGRH